MSDAAIPAETRQPFNKPQAAEVTAPAYLVISSVLITAIVVLFLIGLCGIQLVVVPRHIEMFMDFDTQLPWLTIRLIEIPTGVFLGIYVLGIVSLVVKEAIPQLYFGFKFAINLFVLLLCLIMYFLYLIVLWLPMHQLMESLM